MFCNRLFRNDALVLPHWWINIEKIIAKKHIYCMYVSIYQPKTEQISALHSYNTECMSALRKMQTNIYSCTIVQLLTSSLYRWLDWTGRIWTFVHLVFSSKRTFVRLVICVAVLDIWAPNNFFLNQTNICASCAIVRLYWTIIRLEFYEL